MTVSRTLTSVLLTLAVGVPGVMAQSSSTPRSTFSHPPAGALIAPGEPPAVTMLYTGNVVGYIDPCG